MVPNWENFEFLREIMSVSIWGFVEVGFAILFYLVFIYQKKVWHVFFTKKQKSRYL